MKTLITICIALLLVQGVAVAQPFVHVQDLLVSPSPPGTGINGIAQVDDTWYITNYEYGGWWIYDLNFVQIGSVVVEPSAGNVRTLCYDSNAGTIFVGSYNTGMIWETTTAGVVLNSFSSGMSQFNALSFDPQTDHLWAASYVGQVKEMTRTGATINVWTTGYEWTGIACDWINGTVLLMEGFFEDIVHEYEFDGTYVGIVISEDAVQGEMPHNGVGLAYDPMTGILHATGQLGEIAIWEREPGVAVEITSWSAVKAMYSQ